MDLFQGIYDTPAPFVHKALPRATFWLPFGFRPTSENPVGYITGKKRDTIPKVDWIIRL
jgi:hypothetical protein